MIFFFNIAMMLFLERIKKHHADVNASIDFYKILSVGARPTAIPLPKKWCRQP